MSSVICRAHSPKDTESQWRRLGPLQGISHRARESKTTLVMAPLFPIPAGEGEDLEEHWHKEPVELASNGSQYKHTSETRPQSWKPCQKFNLLLQTLVNRTYCMLWFSPSNHPRPVRIWRGEKGKIKLLNHNLHQQQIAEKTVSVLLKTNWSTAQAKQTENDGSL